MKYVCELWPWSSSYSQQRYSIENMNLSKLLLQLHLLVGVRKSKVVMLGQGRSHRKLDDLLVFIVPVSSLSAITFQVVELDTSTVVMSNLLYLQ